MSSETSEFDEFRRKFYPVFNEIKRRVIITSFVFVAASLIGFFFYESIIRFVINLFSLRGVNLVFTSPFQFISLSISCGLATGVVVVFPLLLYQILSFLRPALKFKEYRLIVRLLPFSFFLFVAGFSFGIFVMKWQIALFLTKSTELGIGNILDISKIMSTVILVATFMGIVFQFPLVILMLTSLGIIDHGHLSKQRKVFYFGALLLTILLPIDSVLADLLLALPIIALYELTIILSRVHKKKKKVDTIEEAKPVELDTLDPIRNRLLSLSGE
jgi:sec-independent protein translocase protein TatC